MGVVMGSATDMMKRFLAAIGLILLYMGIWGVLFYLCIVICGENDSAIATGVLAGTVFFMIGFIPYLDFVAKKVFYFPGDGTPGPLEKLWEEITDINRFDAPAMVKERGNTLIVTWKYVDARWWEILAKAGLKKIYELHIKFNNEKKEVTLIDVKKSVSWRAGPTQVRVSGGFFRGVIFSYEIGKMWGIKENFGIGKIYDYEFTPQEIKNPVMNTILRNGWAVRFGMW